MTERKRTNAYAASVPCLVLWNMLKRRRIYDKITNVSTKRAKAVASPACFHVVFCDVTGKGVVSMEEMIFAMILLLLLTISINGKGRR